MRIAVLSDIHGNIHALEAVERDIKENRIDRIFCLGDIINFGAHPKETLDWVRENCDIVIKGEHANTEPLQTLMRFFCQTPLP
ncbi:MAG: metallophosphoesterase family protein [Persephonella sp.]|nr:metallophosphoesterase family protein [Persephonella sp.]